MGSKCGKSVLYGLGIVVTLLGMIVGVVYGYGKMSQKQTGQEEKLKVVKAEGCLPARDNGRSIIAVEGELKSINGRLGTLKKEQTAGFKAVMEKLNEK